MPLLLLLSFFFLLLALLLPSFSPLILCVRPKGLLTGRVGSANYNAIHVSQASAWATWRDLFEQ